MSLLGKDFCSLLEMPACCYGNKEYFYNITRQGIHDTHIIHLREFNSHTSVQYTQKTINQR